MAELVLKVGNSKVYEDGDVVDAFNRRRTRCVHAEGICHVKLVEKQSNGRRVANSLAEMFRQQTYQYRFERVSLKAVKRINQWTLDEDVFSDVSVKGEYIHVQNFVNRGLRHDCHVIFGEPGAEIWYGGKTKVDSVAMDAVWAEIEQRTAIREMDYVLWPCGLCDLKEHFFVSVNEFDDMTLEDFKAPLLDITQLTSDGQPTRVKKRKNNINWRKDLGISSRTIMDIEDLSKPIDKRGVFSYVHTNIVVAKSLS